MAILSAESHQGKRFILQFSEGTELVQEILRFCTQKSIRSSTIQIMGLLKQVTWQPGALGQTVLLKAPFHILSGSGYVFIEKNQPQALCYALLGGKTEAGTIQFGLGPIRQASVLSVQVILETFEDVEIIGSLDPKTQLLKMAQFMGLDGQSSLSVTTESPSVPSIPSSTSAVPSFEKAGGTPPISWKTVQTASAREPIVKEKQTVVKPIEDLDEPPKPGDILDHETFGKCEVTSVDEGQDRLIVRARSGRLLELAMDYLHLQVASTEGNIRTFKMIRRKTNMSSR